jgi:hypothetical protein
MKWNPTFEEDNVIKDCANEMKSYLWRGQRNKGLCKWNEILPLKRTTYFKSRISFHLHSPLLRCPLQRQDFISFAQSFITLSSSKVGFHFICTVLYYVVLFKGRISFHLHSPLLRCPLQRQDFISFAQSFITLSSSKAGFHFICIVLYYVVLFKGRISFP